MNVFSLSLSSTNNLPSLGVLDNKSPVLFVEVSMSVSAGGGVVRWHDIPRDFPPDSLHMSFVKHFGIVLNHGFEFAVEHILVHEIGVISAGNLFNPLG